MCSGPSTILKAVAAVFFFNCCSLEIPGSYQGASTIMRKVFDWQLSRISLLEMEAVPQSFIP
jgi:hypothetical protein